MIFNQSTAQREQLLDERVASLHRAQERRDTLRSILSGEFDNVEENYLQSVGYHYDEYCLYLVDIVSIPDVTVEELFNIAS